MQAGTTTVCVNKRVFKDSIQGKYYINVHRTSYGSVIRICTACISHDPTGNAATIMALSSLKSSFSKVIHIRCATTFSISRYVLYFFFFLFYSFFYKKWPRPDVKLGDINFNTMSGFYQLVNENGLNLNFPIIFVIQFC